MDKKHCQGCYNDFYNGNNGLGVKECWSLKTAELILRKMVHVDQVPPWNQKAEKYPSCYTIRRYIFVSPERTH